LEGVAVKVKLLGPFKDLANTYDIEVDCVDLEDLIRKLIEKYGRPFEEKIMEDGKLSKSGIILVNGRIVTDTNELRKKLKKEDQVTFLTMTVGG
jgi:MoaD family protein